MCNAWNHPPDCNCGWGGDGFGGYGGYGGGGGYSTFRSTSDGLIFEFPFITYPSYVNPNARCPVCGASVYFYQSPYGGRVRVDSRQNVTSGGRHQVFVASRFRLLRTVKNFFSLTSMLFFNANGFNRACSARSLAFVASGMSGLASKR